MSLTTTTPFSSKQCRPILSERGGNVRCDNMFEPGSNCQLVCNPGWVANGPTQSTCVDGEWTQDRLVCTEVGESQHKVTMPLGWQVKKNFEKNFENF